MELDKKALFPPVGPGHCQQLHPFIFMWWEENLTQRFSTHPYQRDAGTFWAWAMTIHVCRETQPQLLTTPEDWTHITISTGLAAVTRNADVKCVQWVCVCVCVCVCVKRWYLDVSSVTWHFVLIESVLKITIQRPTCKTSIRLPSTQTADASIAM